MQEVCKILWTDVQLPLPWAIKAVSGWFTRHMKFSRYMLPSNKGSKFKKLHFNADADAAAGNKHKKPCKKQKKSPADVSKEVVYSHSTVAERTKFHQSQVLTSPRLSSVLTSPRVTSPRVYKSQEQNSTTTGTPARFSEKFIAGDLVIIGEDQFTFYARASIGTLSTLFSIVFRIATIVLTDYCLRRCWC